MILLTALGQSVEYIGARAQICKAEPAMQGETAQMWRGAGLRWVQTGIAATVILLFSRAATKMLDHEIEVAELANMHKSDWGKALDRARDAQKLVMWGSEGGFSAALAVVWSLVAAAVLVRYVRTSHRLDASGGWNYYLMMAVLGLFAVLGTYWLVTCVITVVHYGDITCSLDMSASAMIDAESRNPYVTCLKQDYTEDIFRRMFVPLLVLLATGFLLSVFTHAEEEMGSYTPRADSAKKTAQGPGEAAKMVQEVRGLVF